MLGQIGAQFLAGNSAIRCLLDLGAALRGDLALSLCPLMKKGWGNANQPGKLGLSCARKGEIALHVHEPKISASLTLLSSASLTHIESETLFNVCMDIDEIRRQRLELIIRESGTVKAVAVLRDAGYAADATAVLDEQQRLIWPVAQTSPTPSCLPSSFPNRFSQPWRLT